MPSPRNPIARLSAMMFLQYAVWGAWFPIAAKFLKASPAEGGLGFDDGQLGRILGIAGSVGALVAPFAGQFADRHFRAERVLAVLLVLGGVVKWYTAQQTGYAEWLWLSILYSVLYMPTLALSNSIAFAHVGDAGRFPIVRVWGTIGWIAASWTFPMLWLQSDLAFTWLPPFLVGPELPGVVGRMISSLEFSALLSFVYAAYCLTLPTTLPKRAGVEPHAFVKAFGLLRRPSFVLLALVGLLVSSIHQVYFMQASIYLGHVGVDPSRIQPAMTVGQFSEILAIALLGRLLRVLGFRRVLTIGALAYFLRYLVWGLVDLPLPVLVLSQLLHGLCYACFFAGAYIYVDRLAPADARHSAQTVFGIILLGGGPVLGGYLNGKLGTWFVEQGVTDFRALWWTLAGAGLVAALALFALFRDETESVT